MCKDLYRQKLSPGSMITRDWAKKPTPGGLLRASDEAKPLALKGAAPVGFVLRRTAVCFSTAGVTSVNTVQSTRWSFMFVTARLSNYLERCSQ